MKNLLPDFTAVHAAEREDNMDKELVIIISVFCGADKYTVGGCHGGREDL